MAYVLEEIASQPGAWRRAAGVAKAEATRPPPSGKRVAIVELVLAQRVAVTPAEDKGLDPDRPRHLTRSVILPSQDEGA